MNSTNLTNYYCFNGCTVQHEFHESGRSSLVRFVLHRAAIRKPPRLVLFVKFVVKKNARPLPTIFVNIFYHFRAVSRSVAAVKVTDLDFDWLHAILAKVGKSLIHYALAFSHFVRLPIHTA